jgi:hypothetical protein
MIIHPQGRILSPFVRKIENVYSVILIGTIILNNAGEMVEKWYFELENKFQGIQCLEHIVMPNHIHFIIQNVGAAVAVGADLCVCPNPGKLGDNTIQGEHTGSPLQRIVQWFKTMSTNEYIRNVKIDHWPPFDGKLWQRNYYEHIIRNDDELNRIRKYIINNPINWHNDENNPVPLVRPDYFEKINEEIL